MTMQEPKSKKSAMTWRSFVNKETAIAAIAVLGILVYVIAYFLLGKPAWTEWPLYAVLILGGVPLTIDLIREIFRGNFGSDLLAGISIITAMILGEYLAGTIIVLMLSGGEALEAYAAGRASSVLRALSDRMPAKAHLKRDGELIEIDLADIKVGDHLAVFPHDVCPVDGIVVEGNGVMDEAYLTGEPYKISKARGSSVISGAINGDVALVVEASRLPTDSRYAKIMEVMAESEQSRPQIRRLADQLGSYYTPIAVVIGVLAWVISGDPTRFLAVVVVATPCPLLIGIPVSIIGAISLAARRGIIIRNPVVLEQIDRCKTLIIDKTGTLTAGRPQLTNMIVGPGFHEADVLKRAASIERYSKHPLALAIIEAAEKRGLPRVAVEEISERPGEGLTALVENSTIFVTSRKKLLASKHPAAELLQPTSSGLECIILIDDQYAATFQFHDEPRPEGKAFIKHLGPEHAFERIMLVSGDRQSEVEYLAKRVGITEIYADQSPEQKVEIVRRETKRARTLFVGDGINDAPAMVTATVGLAFGQTNEVTAEAGGAIILEPSLEKVDELIHISQRFRTIALQSAVGGMALSIFGMGFAAFGVLTPVMGAIAQEVIDLLAVLNALRMSIPPKSLSDMGAYKSPEVRKT